MAINLDEKYPGRAQPKSVRYPQGAFKNRTAPDSQDGTYLEQDWANDMSGFLQWLLANAGITANGQVDNALASQYGEALINVLRDQGATETIPGVMKLSTPQIAQALLSNDHVITPRTLASAFGGTNSKLGTTGYQKFPGGLIAQWGGVVGHSSYTITFPVAFPNDARIMLACHNGTSGTITATCGYIDRTKFSLWLSSVGSAFWFAIGD